MRREAGAWRSWAPVVVWLVAVAAAVAVLVNARFTADLSAFLPSQPTREQAILIDQLREGPASHLILVAIDGTLDEKTLADLSRRTAATLRTDAHFLSINNGETVTSTRDRELLFSHRYLLSDRTVPERFTAPGLHAALEESLDVLASSAGLMLQPLLARDPTGELLHLVETLTAGRDMPTVDGVWVQRSAEQGLHALLLVETRASGSDIDGQEVALSSVRKAFQDARDARAAIGATAASARLVLSGPPVFAVDARNTIEREATRLSLIGASLVALLLGSVYRSGRALVLGLVPMVSGALCGLAVVAAGFGVVHGITLGFGVTLIGEAVDYAIYLFVQRGPRDGEAHEGSDGFWTTIALGVATSVIGFAALIGSGFAGLAQIGVLSIVGLVVAAAVTRWVLPRLLPPHFAVRPMPRLGRALATGAERLRGLRWLLVLLALGAAVVLVLHRDRLWSDDLASLSPVSAADQALDGRLRSELGAPDVRDLVVVTAAEEDDALAGSERVVEALAPLVADGTLAGIDAPSRSLPSRATQRARQAALPDDATLRRAFATALEGLPFSRARFDGFFDDVARERGGALLTRADLDGSSLAIAVRALLGRTEASGGNPARWTAIVALRSPPSAELPRARLASALAPLQHVGETRFEARAIDIRTETQALYAGYLHEAVRAALWGALAIVVLLAIALARAPRMPMRLARVLAPLVIAVLLVAAAQVLVAPMTLFHLVGLLLIVAVGSNYALFFDRRVASDHRDDVDDHALLTSLVVANLTAVIGFGVLGLSSLPVLHAIGTTVAPGALLALLFAAVLAAPRKVT